VPAGEKNVRVVGTRDVSLGPLLARALFVDLGHFGIRQRLATGIFRRPLQRDLELVAPEALQIGFAP
jgi:hypothetical protein